MVRLHADTRQAQKKKGAGFVWPADAAPVPTALRLAVGRLAV